MSHTPYTQTQNHTHRLHWHHHTARIDRRDRTASKQEPGAKHPSSGLSGLPQRQSRARAQDLPGAFLPNSNCQCNSELFGSCILASGLNPNGQTMGRSNPDRPSMSKQPTDLTRFRAINRGEGRRLNEATCPKHGIFIGLNALLPFSWKFILMILTLPNQVLHSDRNIAQLANHPFARSMGPQ